MKPQFLPIKLKYSHWAKDAPIELYIEKPAMGMMCYFGKFVRFKAYFQVGEERRPFTLSLPVDKVLKAFETLSPNAKNCTLLKVVFEKKDGGKLEVKTWEIITE